MRGETLLSTPHPPSIGSISIHSPHARGDRRRGECVPPFLMISIHSPHARGDPAPAKITARVRPISIHSPHARGDTPVNVPFSPKSDFNPLPSCEGRPQLSVPEWLPECYFNPLPSCEGRPAMSMKCARRYRFQSTPLMRGETEYNPIENSDRYISIHSPHARGDYDGICGRGQNSYFNPLPSCEGRPISA